MNSSNLDSTAISSKVVLIGQSGVGKTSIIARYVKNTFSSDCLPTPGASFASKVMNFSDYDKVIKFDVILNIKYYMLYRFGTLQDRKNIEALLKSTINHAM
jgi:GTPase SAR1 family protein